LGEVHLVPLEAIKIIRSVEGETRHAMLLARQNALDAIEEARRAGEDGVARSLARAEVETAHLIRESDHRATEQAKELASKTANRQATLRARAERRLETAVNLIIERIVKA